MPPPYTLPVVGCTGALEVVEVAGVCVAVLSVTVVEDALDCAAPPTVADEFPRTSRCLSSGSSSLSSSVSNASARSGFTVWLRSRDSIEDALEWKDGGGEFGMGCVCLGASIGESMSSSSWAFTCCRVRSQYASTSSIFVPFRSAPTLW